ncbi:MAG: 2-C-methyl-D-erythritol 4-phosphate cytidylyltransferase [Bacteroidales bacterium]|nr:2-C-methyl-D-erythritol 4-phosphate cytidylyltransferase [Bacteroidales bacterium]
MKNIAVVLAGGTGRRMGTDVPKQFLPLSGRTVVEHSVDLFCAHPAIDGVGVVVHRDHLGLMRSLVGHHGGGKLLGVVEGGAERCHSSLAAIEAFGGGDCNLLLHDAARPLLDAATISRVADALRLHEAVAVATPSVDTILVVEDGRITGVPPRASMWCAQTPQAFRAALLREAYRLAMADPSFAATDDCGVVMRYMPHVPIHIVQGSPRNFKITNPGDLRRAELETDNNQ